MWPKHLNVSIVPIQNDYSIPLIYVQYLPTADNYKYHQLLTKLHFLKKKPKHIQSIIGIFLYYAQSVNPTMLQSIIEISRVK